MIGVFVLMTVSITSLFNAHFKIHSEGYLLAFLWRALLSRPIKTPAINTKDV
jgi:hypothetical protein